MSNLSLVFATAFFFVRFPFPYNPNEPDLVLFVVVVSDEIPSANKLF